MAYNSTSVFLGKCCISQILLTILLSLCLVSLVSGSQDLSAKFSGRLSQRNCKRSSTESPKLLILLMMKIQKLAKAYKGLEAELCFLKPSKCLSQGTARTRRYF